MAFQRGGFLSAQLGLAARLFLEDVGDLRVQRLARRCGHLIGQIGVYAIFRLRRGLRIRRRGLPHIRQGRTQLIGIDDILFDLGLAGMGLEPRRAAVGTLHIPPIHRDHVIGHLILRPAIWTCQPHSALSIQNTIIAFRSLFFLSI